MESSLDKKLSPSAKYIEEAEKYLEQGKQSQSKGWGVAAQNDYLGSIAASLIALSKKN